MLTCELNVMMTATPFDADQNTIFTPLYIVLNTSKNSGMCLHVSEVTVYCLALK